MPPPGRCRAAARPISGVDRHAPSATPYTRDIVSHPRVTWRFLVLLALVLLLASSACSSVRYYSQAVRGGLGVVVRAKPITRVLARGQVSEDVARQLRLVLDIRAFADHELGLRVGKSYRSYLDLEREVAVWNVVAAPELAIHPRTWCFPIAGCVSYRGYFRRSGAERFAARMREEGLDVAITGATAYSTLGWLSDPVLNTFLGRSDAQLAGLLFHEVAHATLYAAGDTAFNESYATVVEEAGVRQWLVATGRDDAWASYARHAVHEREILIRLASLRDTLDTVYRSEQADDLKRAEKIEILARFQRQLAASIDVQPELAPWRGWAERDLNNADLAAVGVYWQWVEALRARLTALGWPAFLDEMTLLSDLPNEERQRRLEAWTAPIAASPTDTGSPADR